MARGPGDTDMDEASADAAIPSSTPNPTVAFRCTHALSGHTKAVAAVKFSPDGSLLASGSADRTVALWDAATGARVNTLAGHSCGVSDVAWNPNGRYLATAADDHSLKLWDAETGACLRTLTGHTNYVFCCNFDGAAGHLLASGSFDETLRLWDVRSGRCLREVPAHSDPVTSAAFSYDGSMVVTSSLDGLIRLWWVGMGVLGGGEKGFFEGGVVCASRSNKGPRGEAGLGGWDGGVVWPYGWWWDWVVVGLVVGLGSWRGYGEELYVRSLIGGAGSGGAYELGGGGCCVGLTEAGYAGACPWRELGVGDQGVAASLELCLGQGEGVQRALAAVLAGRGRAG